VAAADALREAIKTRVYAPGGRIPPEKELMGLLGVSRTTLRESLRALEEQGLIYRQHGVGTFVSENLIVNDLSQNFGITEMITRAGYTPGSVEVATCIEEASPEIAQALKLRQGGEVYVVDRVRTANGESVVHSIDILPLDIVGRHTIAPDDIAEASIYDYLANQLSQAIVKGEATLRPVRAAGETARKLNVAEGGLLLLITQTDFDAGHTPVLHSIEYHLPDKLVFAVQRRGPYR
jgi:GntR family transcriptional regulator